MIYKRKLKHFNPKFEAVGCFVQCNGKIILLHRQDHKPEGDTWGIPSGKVRKNERPLNTVLRETHEETGLKIPKNNMEFFFTVFVKFPEYDFIYHIFHTKIGKRAKIKISAKEHKAAKWISPTDALDLPLIGDLDSCIKIFFGK